MTDMNDYTTPNINYKSIKINDIDVALSSRCRASFTSPYNRIDFVINPTNCSLSYYEVRITQENDEYDIGVGNLAYWDANIPTSKDYSFSIPVNSTLFNHGDGVYRISCYGRNANNGYWDFEYIFFTVHDEQYNPGDSEDGYWVIATQEPPTHGELGDNNI